MTEIDMTEYTKDFLKTEEFVKRNIIPADNGGTVCIDGRYSPEQSAGAIRAPGGDFGFIMAIQAELIEQGIASDSARLVEAYLSTVEELRVQPGGHYHSNEHNHEAGRIGCGHIAKASNPDLSHLYFPLTAEHVRNLYDVFHAHESTDQSVLEGTHEESGVLLVHGPGKGAEPKYSVNSLDTQTGEMYFVVDIDRAERFIESIAPILSEKLGLEVNVPGVRSHFMTQLGSTASLLAPSLMQYSVVIGKQGNATVSEAGKVKPADV